MRGTGKLSRYNIILSYLVILTFISSLLLIIYSLRIVLLLLSLSFLLFLLSHPASAALSYYSYSSNCSGFVVISGKNQSKKHVRKNRPPERTPPERAVFACQNRLCNRAHTLAPS